MSSLLEQAIIDAKELREAALRFAENQVIEKHASELKEAIDSFLNEQEPAADPMAAGAAAPAPEAIPEDIPDAATLDTANEPQAGGDEDVITVSMDDLRTMLSAYEDQDIAPQDLKDPFEILADDKIDTGENEEPEEIEFDLGSVEKAQAPAVSPEMTGLMEEVRRFMNEMGHPESLDEDYLDEEDLEESYEIEEEVVDEDEAVEEDLHTLVEELVVDIMDGRGGGWAGRPEVYRQEQEKVNLARLADTKRQQELKDLQDGMKKLAGVNESLKSQNAVLDQTVSALKAKLEEVNLSNAKLLYQNEVLMNSSLNERQKQKVVESIRKAQNITEAKVIFETLQSAAAAGATSTGRKLESLHEAINRPSHTIPSKRNLNESVDHDQYDYWKKLAGIK
jgi:hypothetical protein